MADDKQRMTDELKQTIADYTRGTCKSEDEIRRWCDVPDEFTNEDILEALAEHGLQICSVCGWWVETDELADDERNDPVCLECVE